MIALAKSRIQENENNTCGLPPYYPSKFTRIDTDFTLQWLKVHGKKDLEDCLPKPKPTPGPKPKLGPKPSPKPGSKPGPKPGPKPKPTAGPKPKPGPKPSPKPRPKPGP